MRKHPGWQAPLETIRLQLTAAYAPARFREPAFRVLDAIQQAPPAVQLDALFLTATAMALTVGLDPHDLVVRAKRMIPDVDGPFSSQLAAITDYAAGELAK